MAALCNRAGHYIFAVWFLSFFLLSSSFLLAYSQRSEIGCLPTIRKKLVKQQYLLQVLIIW